MTWSLKHIEKLKAEGKIRGYKENSKSFQREFKEPAGRIVTKHFPKRSKEKDWIAWNLLYWCNEHAVSLEEEYRFHPERKWKADYAIPAFKILIEYEGLFSEKSRHTTAKGFTGDTEKYNSAQSLGWKVLRVTALNYQTLITELNKHL